MAPSRIRLLLAFEWHPMSVETARAFFTYLTTTIVVVGGFVFLYAVHADPTSRDLVTIVAGFMGAALQFLFGAQITAQTNKQAAAAYPAKPPVVKP